MGNESSELRLLLEELLAIRNEVYREGNVLYDSWEEQIKRRDFIPGARNLAYYLAVRRHDLRRLQKRLAPWGVSSLGMLESRVMATLDSVITTIGRCAGLQTTGIDYPSLAEFTLGERLLQANTRTAFGPKPVRRYTRIMVTLEAEAADNYSFVKTLLENGMDAARINCAHDDPAVWAKMIEHVRAAEREVGRSCKIIMDIAGPKLRIGRILTAKQEPRVKRGECIFLTERENLTDFCGLDIAANCNIGSLLSYVAAGDLVRIDDGHIEGVVEEKREEGLVIRVNKVYNDKGAKLKKDKGLNFPGLQADAGILTDKDREHLAFVCRHADIVACSFVRNAEDIGMIQRALDEQLAKTPGRELGLMIKVETMEAVHAFPSLLVAGAGSSPFSVMIARGDLAAEAGYERLAALQEEILWISEAAHIPVVWATQVLENLVKTGIPTRAEMTDAAIGAKAECVMLNKGEHIHDAVLVLDHVLRDIARHRHKKTVRLKALPMAQALWEK